MNFLDLFDYKFKPSKDMSKEEAIEELELFRKLWTWIPEEVRAWLCRIGYPTRLVRRDYHGFVGRLATPYFEIKSVDIEVSEDIRDYFTKTITTEIKTVNLPVNQLIDYEFIHSKEVMPLEDEIKQTALEGAETGL